MRKNVAIIGGGISGLTTAYYLSQTNTYSLSLFEAEPRLGGHAHTAYHEGQAFDTTVVGYHVEAYPLFAALIKELGIDEETRVFRQDLCFHSPGSLDYLMSYNPLNAFMHPLTTLKTARCLQIFSRSIVAYRQGRMQLPAGCTLDAFLQLLPLSQPSINRLILPLIHMFVGLELAELRTMPADFLLEHLYEHKVLHHSSLHSWRAWKQGTATYINALEARIQGQIYRPAPVRRLERTSRGDWQISFSDREAQTFDLVVLATPPATAFRLLAEPSRLEQDLLGPWQQRTMQRVIHSDVSVLPQPARVQGFWNPYVLPAEDRCGASYVIKKIQPEAPADLIVSWQPIQPIAPEKILASEAVPISLYTEAALQQRQRLPEINHQGTGLYFCGAHFKYGWHESGVASALDVCERIRQDHGQA